MKGVVVERIKTIIMIVYRAEYFRQKTLPGIELAAHPKLISNFR